MVIYRSRKSYPVNKRCIGLIVKQAAYKNDCEDTEIQAAYKYDCEDTEI